jgi:hypothetical protein
MNGEPMSDLDAARERFREALTNPPEIEPVEDTRKFLHAFVSDADGMDDAMAHIARLAAANPRSVIRGLRAMEALLAATPNGVSLLALVAWDANCSLDDPSEDAARAWLAGFSGRVRDVLGDQAPPPIG